ncbi:MAG: nuclear transport factor 2 family protein [Haliscomenobacter sp.]|nr:nuclear transport factor 2 family protein [Haliscomenobacter sp.]
MKITIMTNQKAEQLEEQYNNFVELIKNNYPLEKMSLVIVPDIMGYGANLDEKIFNLDELYEGWRIQKEQSVGLDIQFEITPISRRISPGENVAICVDEIKYTLTVEGVKHENELRLSTIFEVIEERWMCTHFHTSYGLVVTNDAWALDVAKMKNEELQRLVDERTIQLQNSILELKSTQAQLIQSEKLASLGELTAGIAHEIQNPLNFVNNFSEVSAEMLNELKEELAKGETEEVHAIADDLKTNLQKITHHGQRASSIVKSMLEHSRQGRDAMHRVSTDINALADEYLRLAYHGWRAKDNGFNCNIETHFDPDLPLVSVIPQDIGRVLLNLIGNAFYAVNERNKKGEAGYQPTVSVSSLRGSEGERGKGDYIQITIQDNGSGIPESIREKIFQPFFTTKPTGQGTGLGLSLSYDIIKAHGGELKVETKEGEGSTFTIQIPLS